MMLPLPPIPPTLTPKVSLSLLRFHFCFDVPHGNVLTTILMSFYVFNE